MNRISGSSRLRLLFALAALLPLTGCLFRTHKVAREASPSVVQEATQQDLIEKIDREAQRIRTLNATVDIDTEVGGARKGKVTEYQQIRGYVLVRKPAMLRMIGLFPIVRNRAFDMVSDGQTFKLSIPAKNKFYVGRNDVIHASKQPLENLRPQHIMDALLLRPIDPQNEVAVVESTNETVRDPKTHKTVQIPDYTMVVVARSPQGWYLSRKIVFSRTDLQPYRQIVYDKLGNVATDARYEKYQEYEGAPFPSQIVINRPQEEYEITLSVVKLKLNEQLTDDQFDLPQPAGAQLVRLDVAPQQRASDGNSEAAKPAK
jgi:outer membrane lipoprotein-sorting protein